MQVRRKLFVLLFVWNVTELFCLQMIESILPIPNNELATNYSGFTVRAVFETPASGNCIWEYSSGSLNGQTSQFFVTSFRCYNRNTSIAIATCASDEISPTPRIESNFTYLPRLTTDLDVSMLCGTSTPDLVLTLPTINVRDCLEIFPNNMSVAASSYDYNAVGEFNCPNDEKLFFLDGTERQSRVTTCEYSAKWTDEDSLQCWTAPDVTISSSFQVIVGDDLNVTCEHNDVMPTETAYVLTFEGRSSTEQQSPFFTLSSFLPNEDGSEISCLVVTPYTEIYQGTGRSPNYPISVLYPPYQDMTTSCIWNINEAGTCAITFYSNPEADFVELTQNGTSIVAEDENLVTGAENMQTFHFQTVQAAKEDEGTYALVVSWPTSPNDRHEIKFNITVRDQVSDPSGQNTTNTVVIVVVVVVVVLLLIAGGLAGLYYKRKTERKNKKETSLKEERINPIYASSNQPADVADTYAKVDKSKKRKGTSVKDEKANPVYSSANQSVEADIHEIFDKSMEEKEIPVKEERINPAYVSANQPFDVADVYAQVDKNRKKKAESSEKEERINPIYLPADEMVAVAYAKVDKTRKPKKGAKIHEEVLQEVLYQ